MNSSTDHAETDSSKITVSTCVEIDLRNIENGILLDEMRRRGFFLSAYDVDTDHQTLIEQCTIRVFDILVMMLNQQTSRSIQAIEDLVRDVLHELTPRNETPASPDL